MNPILATVSASDEIDPRLWILAWCCFLLAGLFALSALAYSLGSRKQLALLLSVTGALLSLFPIAFAFHLYTIDFVAVSVDGTKASGPLWQALAMPSVPLVVALLAIGIVLLRSSRKTEK